MVNSELLRQASSRLGDLKGELEVISRLKPGAPIYAPHGRADSLAGTGLAGCALFAIEPRGKYDGRLVVDELVALTGLRMVVADLADTFLNLRAGGFGEGAAALDLNEDDYVDALIAGMADFVYYLSHAAWVREELIRGRTESVGETEGVFWWDHYATAVGEDSFFLGQAVCLETVKAVGYKTKSADELPSRMKGADLAAGLYLALLTRHF